VENQQLQLQTIKYSYFDTETVKRITEPTDPKLIKEKQGRGGTYKYVPADRVISELNNVFNFLWDFTVLNGRIEQDNHVVVEGRLTVKFPSITLTKSNGEVLRIEAVEIGKTNYGSADVKRWSDNKPATPGSQGHKAGDPIDLADDYKAAASDCIKKCASLFGLFLDVYASNEKDPNKPSKTQIDAIYIRGKALGWNESETKEWVKKDFGAYPEDLDTMGALQVPGRLIKLKKEKDAEAQK